MMRSTIGPAACVIGLACVTSVPSARQPGASSATERQPYAFDAKGRAARVDQTWELRKPDGQEVDIFTSLTRCEDRIFLSDIQNHIFRLDFAANNALTVFAGEEAGIGRPWALTADCPRERLYVVNEGLRTVVTLNARSGQVLGKQSYGRGLFQPRSANLLGQDEMYVGGLWNSEPARALPSLAAESFFASLRIGLKLSLTSGAVEGGLRPFEPHCPAAAACTFADLDRIRGASPATWVASQGTSTRIGLYDVHGTATRFYPVISPKFLRDGTELPINSSGEAAERWKSRNSLVRRVFSVNDYLVTIHTLTEIGPDWKFGEQAQFQVFMNVFALDGTGLVSDIRVPDIPIGRDETHLYTIDYGPNRRRNAVASVKLVRFPIARGPEGVMAQRGGFE